jgi:mannose/fructose/N-acetylgalactosamine-specific phosphotransferase system component IIC
LTHKVAIVGTGIIGMINAIVILENNKKKEDKFDVTVLVKRNH